MSDEFYWERDESYPLESYRESGFKVSAYLKDGKLVVRIKVRRDDGSDTFEKEIELKYMELFGITDALTELRDKILFDSGRRIE